MARVHRSKSLTKNISKKLDRSSKNRLTVGDKFSLDDDCEIKEDEFTWEVKIKDDSGSYAKRLLAVGPNAVRVLLVTTNEEVSCFPYKKMKEYSQNEGFKLFQITWFPSEGIEECVYFKTSKGNEIQNVIGRCIKDLLIAKNVENPDEVINQHTFERPPDVQRMKVGGRQRSVSTNGTKKKQVKRRKEPVSEKVTRKSKGTTT